MNKKLKPCPFCGGRAHIMKMGYPHWIYCEECGAKIHGGVMGEEEGEAASIVAWNRRIGESMREKEDDKSASEKKEEKLFNADDVLDALVYAYAKCILQKYSMVECRTKTTSAAFAIGAVGGCLLGKDYEERLKNIPEEAKEYLRQKTDNSTVIEAEGETDGSD